MTPRLALLALLMLVFSVAAALAGPVTVQVDANGLERRQHPVTANLKVPDQISHDDAKALAAAGATLSAVGSKAIAAQVELVSDGGKVVAARVYWIEPQLKADEKKTYRLAPRATSSASTFRFTDAESHRDLLLGETSIWRHDSLKYDPEKHNETYKHFHQVYGFHGDGFITQGVGGKQFPHHRGLYMGWNKTSAGGKSYDTWHCSNGVSLRHRGFVISQELAGAVVAKSVSLADWTGGDGKAIITETRDVLTWNAGPGAIVLDFDIMLRSKAGDIKLDGDPQHAGFQFRAHGDVGNTKAVYIYPTTAVKKGNDVWEGCKWVINTFTIKDNAYAVAYFDRPDNPNADATVFSTRNYGRFGAFAKQELKADAPLVFRYRVVIFDLTAHPEKSVEHFDAMHQAYLKPVKVTAVPD